MPPADRYSLPEPDAAERARVAELLAGLGGTEEEIRRAAADGSAGALALDLALREGRAPLSLDEAARRAGVDAEALDRLWRALGFAAETSGSAAIPAALVDILPIITAGAVELLGDDVALGLVRVIGTTSARIAEAIVDAFRIQYEVPEISAGTRYSDIVERYTQITKDSLPALQLFMAEVLKAHLVRVAGGAWAPDAEHLATRRDLFVGFADLVGYTALSRTLSPSELATLLGRFEESVADVVTGGGGRLVKLIGDSAMFVAPSAAEGRRIAWTLGERLADTTALPPARIGADCGPVLSLYGDYYGDVVNRAARLVALANPGTIVVSDSVIDENDNFFAFERLPPQAMKGFVVPTVSYRLRER